MPDGSGERVRCDPVGVARALLARFPIREPEDVRIELIAATCDAFVIPRATGGADARLVRDASTAYICIGREAMLTPRGRFSIAHELTHHQNHSDFDAIERIHGAPRASGREFRVENEADIGAAELLLPHFLFTPLCAALPPTLDNVAALATRFRTSLSATARRWAALSPAPCAYVESRHGRIVEAKRSAGFRGTAVKRRMLEAGTLAAELARTDDGPRATRVHELAWGSPQAKAEVIEESLRIAGTPAVLTWLWHG